MIRFLFLFGVLSATTRWSGFMAAVREPYCDFLARSLEFFFSLVGYSARRAGSNLSVGIGDSFSVVPSCDGLVLIALFVAGVCAIPRQTSGRPYLLAAGCLFILVIVNWIRLVVLAFTAFYRPALFDLVHLYIAQAVLIVIVGVLFVVWLSKLEVEAAIIESPRPL